jgi:hypothetical protein
LLLSINYSATPYAEHGLSKLRGRLSSRNAALDQLEPKTGLRLDLIGMSFDLKEKGNQLFKEGDFIGAEDLYSQA